MLVRPRHFDESITVVRHEERPWGFLVHALGCVPIWGFVVNCAFWLHYRTRSREMVFHIQQAIQYHIFLLLPVLAWNLVGVCTGVVGQLSPGIAELIDVVTTFALIAFLTASTALALYGGAMVYAGRPFLYPGIGRRVLMGTLNKLMED